MVRRTSIIPELRKLARTTSRRQLAKRFGLSPTDVKHILDWNFVSHEWLQDVVNLKRRIDV